MEDLLDLNKTKIDKHVIYKIFHDYVFRSSFYIYIYMYIYIYYIHIPKTHKFIIATLDFCFGSFPSSF